MRNTKSMIGILAAFAFFTMSAVFCTAQDMAEVAPEKETADLNAADGGSGVPPAWVVTDMETMERADTGDADAMWAIANGYVNLAESPNIEASDDERKAMVQEAAKWMRKRAEVVVGDAEILERAEGGDAPAMLDIGYGYLSLAATRGLELEGEARTETFQKGLDWLRRRAENLASDNNLDTMWKNSVVFLQLPVGLELNEEEHAALFQEAMNWAARRAKSMAGREGDVESVRKRAEAGDAAAQRVLGFRYSLGVDVEKDEAAAFEWTQKAAQQGDAKAMFNLGNDYATGKGVEADATEARRWFRKAAEALLAQVGKGEMFDCRAFVITGQDLLGEGNGKAVRDPALGMAFLEIAARCGDAEGMRLFGEQYAIGKNVEEDFDTALFWLRRASRHGDEKAAGIVGRINTAKWHRRIQELNEKADAGDSEAERLVEAVAAQFQASRRAGDPDWVTEMKVRAAGGFAPAQNSLGFSYAMGDGVSQDDEQAVEWWRKAADQGESEAMWWLGVYLSRGVGAEKDVWQALQLWQRSHELGCEDATEWLALLGDDVYREEAEGGDPSAQFLMGAFFQNGYGGERNPELAVEWYRKAAEQGEMNAQFELAMCYLRGDGVEQDGEKAKALLVENAARGHVRSAEFLQKESE